MKHWPKMYIIFNWVRIGCTV